MKKVILLLGLSLAGCLSTEDRARMEASRQNELSWVEETFPDPFAQRSISTVMVSRVYDQGTFNPFPAPTPVGYAQPGFDYIWIVFDTRLASQKDFLPGLTAYCAELGRPGRQIVSLKKAENPGKPRQLDSVFFRCQVTTPTKKILPLVK